MIPADGWWVPPSRYDSWRNKNERPLLFHYYRRGRCLCNGSKWVGPFITISMGNTDGLRCLTCESKLVLPISFRDRMVAERNALRVKGESG